MKLKRVCEILGLSNRQVMRNVRKGRLKAVRLESGQLDYDYESVMLFKNASDVVFGRGVTNLGDPKRENAIYVRASHGSRQAIDRQLSILRKWLVKYCLKKGVHLPKTEFTFVDCYAADEGKRRTGFTKLFRLVREEKVGIVFAISLDRFYRGARVFLELVFEEFGTSFCCLDDFMKRPTWEEKEKTDIEQGIYAKVSKDIHERNSKNKQAVREFQKKRANEILGRAYQALKKLRVGGRQIEHAVLFALVSLCRGGSYSERVIKEIERRLQEIGG